jgi:hypothetical protein
MLALLFILRQGVETVLWGTTAYMIFRALGGRDSRWYVGVFVTFVVLVSYEYGMLYFFQKEIMRHGMLTNTRIAELIQESSPMPSAPGGVVTFVTEAIFIFLRTAVGFKLAQLVFKKRII